MNKGDRTYWIGFGVIMVLYIACVVIASRLTKFP